MNKIEKLAFVDAVLTQRPDAKIDVYIHNVVGQKPAEEIASVLSEVSGCLYTLHTGIEDNFFKIRAGEVTANIFFQPHSRENVEKMKKRLQEIAEEKVQLEQCLSGYMIEDVAWGIEDESH